MDVDSLLKDAQAQKTKANGLRKRGNVDEAREILLDVIDDLEHVAQEASDTFYTSKEWLLLGRFLQIPLVWSAG